MGKYDVEYLTFPVDTPLKDAIQAYKDKTGLEPTKAIVPVRTNTDSPFHYDLETLGQGARIEVEQSHSVSVVMMTDRNITWGTS